jgi:integrase
MSVKKRTWKTSKGEQREAWIVRYADAQGHRHIATFERKKDADEYHATVRVDVRKGTHVAPSKSATVAEAGKLWLAACDGAGLERTSVNSYRQHFELHMLPYLGALRLSAITVATIREWQDKLRKGTSPAGETEAPARSPDMVRRVTRSFGTLLADAQERGLVGQNVVRSLMANRRGKDRKAERRAKGKLRIGVDIPAPDEIRAMLGAATGRWRVPSCWWRRSAAYAPRNCAACLGLTWISERANCTCGSARTDTTRSARPSPTQASARYRFRPRP